ALGSCQIAQTLPRDTERDRESRVARGARGFDQELEVSERRGERTRAQRRDCGAQRGRIVGVVVRRIEIGEKARAFGPQRRETRGVTAPGLEHGHQVLQTSVKLFEARRIEGERSAAALAGGLWILARHGLRALTRFAPGVASLRDTADPRPR